MVERECNNLGVINRMAHVSYPKNWNTKMDGEIKPSCRNMMYISSKFNSKMLQNSYTSTFQEKILECLDRLLSNKHTKEKDDYLTILKITNLKKLLQFLYTKLN